MIVLTPILREYYVTAPSLKNVPPRSSARLYLILGAMLCTLPIAHLAIAQTGRPILSPTPEPSSTVPLQAPPSAQSGPGQNAGVEASSYIIGAEDVLQVTVWKEPTLSGSFPVRPDGMVSMVLLGDVRAAGITPMQLASNLTQQLKKYVQDPLVTVVVAAVNSQRIFMVGEVAHVGPIPLTAGMTPLQAIAAAGGLTPYARTKHIYILRGIPGHQQKIPFNYKAALRGEGDQSVALMPGDTVVVQ
jgi:polysaccharide export outer membrane protein